MAITLSDNAVRKIITLVNDDAQKGLRVKVVGGGCSGLQYRMDLDEERTGDKIFERDGAKLLVDRKSFLYLNGTEVDYEQSLVKSGFVFHNPAAKRSCSCGESFSV